MMDTMPLRNPPLPLHRLLSLLLQQLLSFL
jgi:hypothetical protein